MHAARPQFWIGAEGLSNPDWNARMSNPDRGRARSKPDREHGRVKSETGKDGKKKTTWGCWFLPAAFNWGFNQGFYWAAKNLGFYPGFYLGLVAPGFYLGKNLGRSPGVEAMSRGHSRNTATRVPGSYEQRSQPEYRKTWERNQSHSFQSNQRDIKSCVLQGFSRGVIVWCELGASKEEVMCSHL